MTPYAKADETDNSLILKEDVYLPCPSPAPYYTYFSEKVFLYYLLQSLYYVGKRKKDNIFMIVFTGKVIIGYTKQPNSQPLINHHSLSLSGERFCFDLCLSST